MKHNCDAHQDAALLPAVCGHHTAQHKTPRCLRPPYRAAQDPPLSAATIPSSTRPPAVCGHHTAQHKTPVTEPVGSVNRDVIEASKRDVHMCK
ncbi:hypothetical protein FI667_g5341, partial [Globisporangium splendens]